MWILKRPKCEKTLEFRTDAVSMVVNKFQARHSRHSVLYDTEKFQVSRVADSFSQSLSGSALWVLFLFPKLPVLYQVGVETQTFSTDLLHSRTLVVAC